MKLLLATAALFLVAVSPAAADSIVYAKQGNLFLTTADGSAGYQLTRDGGYSSPSQAADGTIGAVRNRRLVRLDRSGRLLSAVDAMGTGGGAIGGPYEARISPDGSRFAYYFYVQTSFDDLENSIRWVDTGSYPEPDYVNPNSGFAEPAILCRGPVGKTENPTWSSDGSTLAYGAPDGVHAINAECTGDRLLIAGGAEPAFGPAGVSAPVAQTQGTPASPASTPAQRPAALSRVSLHPRTFRMAKGTTVRFTLSGPAQVRIASKGMQPRSVEGRAGSNAVRVHPRRGAHRLTLSVGGKRASVSFRVRA